MIQAKKWIAISVMAALILSAAAGCGSSGGPSAAPADSGDGGEKPTLKALVTYQNGMDYNTDPAAKFLEEKTGYHVVYDTLPADSPYDKLNAIMASGADYDFIQMGEKSQMEYVSYAKEGALTDLKPLVEQYGPNVSANIGKDVFDIVTIDNTYYAIPNVKSTGNKDTGNIGMGILVRQDLMDKLGGKTPSTAEEFAALLQQVKDKDPNKQGQKNIPLVTDQGMDLAAAGIGGAFGIATAWSDVNGKLVPDVESAGYKDYVAYLKNLYTKGLLDKEAPTNTAATVKQKFTSGRAFAMLTGWSAIPDIVKTMKKTQPEAKLKYLPALSGQYGQAARTAVSKNSISMYTVIPKTSKYAADVMKYFNAKLEENTYRELALGKENVDYTVKDGAYYPILPAFFDDRGNSNFFMNGCSKNDVTYWLCRVRKDNNLYDAYSQLNYAKDSAVVVDPVNDVPLSIYSEIADSQAALNDIANQFLIKSVTGNYSDAVYSNFVANWKSQGGDALVKTINDWYASK